MRTRFKLYLPLIMKEPDDSYSPGLLPHSENLPNIPPLLEGKNLESLNGKNLNGFNKEALIITQEIMQNSIRFQAMIENSADAIVLINRFGKLTYASPGTKRVLGYLPEELLNFKTPSQLLHPDDKKDVIKLFTVLFKNPDDKITVQFRVKSKEGDYRWIEIVASNLLQNKHVDSVVLNFRDITNQKLDAERKEEEIRNSALRLSIHEALSQKGDLKEIMDDCLQAISDKLHVSLAKIWLMDKDKKLSLLSIVGTNSLIKTIKHSRWAMIKDGRIAKAKRSYLTNNALSNNDLRDKTWLKKHKIKAFAGYPLILNDQLVGVLILYSKFEITPHTHEALDLIADALAQGIGRKQAEEALISSEKKYHTIFASLTEGVILQDLTGKILAANRSAEEILSMNFNQLVKSSRDVTVNRYQYINEDGSPFSLNKFPFAVALSIGKPQKNITIGVVKEKRVDWIIVNSIPLKDENGNITTVASSFQDVTKQKTLEKQKDEFISIASHELRTPLTTIKSLNEILLMKFKDKENQYFLNKMNNQIDKLIGLISELLDVSKIQSERLTLNKTKVELKQFIIDLVEDIQIALPTHQIVIKKIPEVEVHMDKYRIYQVLVNLISNAIKYSPNSEKVLLDIRRQADKIIFKVQDFGIGITPRDQKRIFEPFFQAQTTIRQSHSGLGLGLHITKAIIERHGGSIKVQSEKRKGSVFSFYLPIK